VIYQPDPYPEWTILARGPSLRDCTLEAALPGSRVVAVNGAIYHHAIPADYLASLDAPDSWIDPDIPGLPWGANRMPEGVTHRADRWRRLQAQSGMEVRRFPGGRGGNGDVSMLIGDRRRTVPYAKWTVLLAIAWARWGGARRIRVLGADMSGTGRAHGRGTRIAPKRWVKEGSDFHAAVVAARGVGVDVERWVPSEVRA
jgi:hypothetical protein